MSAAASRSALAKDSLGCSLGALVRDQHLATAGLSIFRKTSTQTTPAWIATPESDRGLLLGISLAGLHRRHIRHQGRMQAFDFAPGSIYLRSFAEPYAAEIATPFDFLLIEMPTGALASATDAIRADIAGFLPNVLAQDDPVLFHLAQALLPALAEPAGVSALVVDQIALAMQMRIVTRIAGIADNRSDGRRLSTAQEARAKELLLANLRGDLLVADLAAACGLSRSVFMRAFKATTGTTPYQWLLARRIERAKILLATTRVPLADVAARCGFADQSHFTRTFTRAVGKPPRAWRSQA